MYNNSIIVKVNISRDVYTSQTLFENISITPYSTQCIARTILKYKLLLNVGISTNG